MPLLIFGALPLLVASSSAPAQNVPIRELTAPVAATTRSVRSIIGDVRESPAGELILNDLTSRQLVRFDASLKNVTVLRDSVEGSENAYGPRLAILIKYRGDSLLFLETNSGTLLLLAPNGTFVKVMALPNAKDIGLLTNPRVSADARGRLIYEGFVPSRIPGSDGRPAPRQPPRDSAPLLRADFDLRRVDTIAMVKLSAPDERVVTGEGNAQRIETVVNPLQAIDNWAITSSGSVALVRSFDYHVDWLLNDGRTVSSPKMPFAWRRLVDSEKQRLIDSARTFRETRDSVNAAKAKAEGRAQYEIIRIEDGRERREADPRTYVTTYVPLNKIPDYYPPVRTGATRADLDNNLWILPTTTSASVSGELIYDVVNEQGELFERVRVPSGRSIAGFGRGGVVYLMFKVDNGWFIERTRVQRPSDRPSH